MPKSRNYIRHTPPSPEARERMRNLPAQEGLILLFNPDALLSKDTEQSYTGKVHRTSDSKAFSDPRFDSPMTLEVCREVVINFFAHLIYRPIECPYLIAVRDEMLTADVVRVTYRSVYSDSDNIYMNCKLILDLLNKFAEQKGLVPVVAY